jgi:hypothetical protein
VIQNKHNFFLAPIVLVILAATAWSVMSAQKQYKTAPAVPLQTAGEPQKSASSAVTNIQGDVFFEKLYEERLKEEGNRTKVVEELIRRGVLSDKPARFVREKGAKPNE